MNATLSGNVIIKTICLNLSKNMSNQAKPDIIIK